MAFVTVHGVRLEFQMIESAAGRPDTLVFLHEGLGSLALWRDFPAKVAATTGWRTFVYSRRGYGWSDPVVGPRSVRYMHDEAEAVLPDLLDRFGIDSPVLIGHSDGGSIALIHAGGTRRPVRGIVTMAAHVFVEDVTIRSIAEAKVTFETTKLGERLGRYHRDAAAAFWDWNDIWLHPDFRSWNIEACLPAIACPVLAMQGVEDEYGTGAQVEAIVAGVGSSARTLMLPACRHSPHRDQEAATTAAIAGFVAELERSEG
ncbi:MAG: alpha/beta hydrolase [Alphaproteobacteria bacterium]|nr:alpha/beta hydrolase [Alphaproteobacteria bacterium]